MVSQTHATISSTSRRWLISAGVLAGSAFGLAIMISVMSGWQARHSGTVVVNLGTTQPQRVSDSDVIVIAAVSAQAQEVEPPAAPPSEAAPEVETIPEAPQGAEPPQSGPTPATTTTIAIAQETPTSVATPTALAAPTPTPTLSPPPAGSTGDSSVTPTTGVASTGGGFGSGGFGGIDGLNALGNPEPLTILPSSESPTPGPAGFALTPGGVVVPVVFPTREVTPTP